MCGWAWACPVCNDREYDGTFSPKADKATEGELGVCSKCFPEILGATSVEIRPGVFVPGTDMNLRAATLEKAKTAERAYEIIFPKKRKAIMEALNLRNRRNMNWVPGETLADILAENVEHGVK